MATSGSDMLVCFGECMIELRGAGPQLLRQGFAGDTFNTAVYLSRLRPPGATVHYAMGIGTDPFVATMRQAWRDEGVIDDLVREVPGRSTGLYTIHVDEHGERRFNYWRDTSAARGYFDAPSTPLEERANDIALLYLSGISVAILPSAGRDRLFALMARLRARGARVAWDNNYRPTLWASVTEARETMARFGVASDIALLTLDDEIALHGGRDAEAVMADALDLPCSEVVVKRGARSTVVRQHGEAPVEVPVLPVARPIDTTAAGDGFAGAYLAARLRGRSPAEAAAAGNRMAAIVIQHSGAIIPREAMPKEL